MPKFLEKLMLKFQEAFEFESDIKPICPYCEKEIDSDYFVGRGGAMNQKVTFQLYRRMGISFFTNVFFCPHCRKILSISRSVIVPTSGSSS